MTLIDASKAFDRVQYVKLFKLLLSRNVCPVVARFLCVMYTTQSFRVKWCSHITELTRASNGVKQGGVMSPLLFTLYIDVLLCRLKNSGYGCHIGNIFCGAIGVCRRRHTSGTDSHSHETYVRNMHSIWH